MEGMEDPSVPASDSSVREVNIPGVSKDVFLLRDPESGNLLYLVPTNFLSEQAARDVEALTENLRPQVVAVEGSLKMSKLLRSVMDVAQPLPGSMTQIFPRLIGGGVGKLALQSANTFAEAITGVPLLVDFFAAEDKARDVSARFCAVLVSTRLPLMPPVIQQREGLGSGGGREGMPSVDRLLILAEQSKCEDPPSAVRAFLKVLEAASRGDEVAMEDLSRVRRCAKKVVEQDRLDKIKLGQQLSQTDNVRTQFFSAENQRLTTALRACTREGTAVALVSGSRVYDIKRFWDTAPVLEDTPFLETSEEQIIALGKAAKKEGRGVLPSAGTVIGVGTVGLMAYYRPRLLLRGAMAGGIVFGGVWASGAYGWARANRMLLKLESAAQRMQMLGDDAKFDVGPSTDDASGDFV